MSDANWKRLSTLSNDDFRVCTVLFEYRDVDAASEDYDAILNRVKSQEWAKPFPDHGPLVDDGTAYLIRSRFTLADGSEHYGFCSPCDDSGLDYVQPVLISARGHVRFWYDWRPQWKEPEETCRKLGKVVSEIFPARCQALVSCDGHDYEVLLEKIYVFPGE